MSAKSILGKSLRLFIAAVMVAGLQVYIPQLAFADDGGADKGTQVLTTGRQDDAGESTDDAVLQEEVLEEEVIAPAVPMDDPEALLEDYMQVVTAEVAESYDSVSAEAMNNVIVSKQRGSRLKGAEKKAYDLLRSFIEEIAAGSESRETTSIELSFSQLFSEEVFNVRYSAGQLGVTAIVDQGAITKEAKDAVVNQYNLDVSAVMKALLYDSPYHLYWFDKTFGMATEIKGKINAELIDGEYQAYCTGESSFVFYFAVSNDYAPSSFYVHKFKEVNKPIQTNRARIQAIQTAVTNAARIVSTAATTQESDYAKLDYYKDQICEAVLYDEDASKDENYPYGDPWQLISVFDNDPNTNVVCEGYSKAFKYLCDLTTFDDKSLDCYLVTGEMVGGEGAGDHMWNLAVVGGENYLVDVTNCDEGTVGNMASGQDALFLVGNDNPQSATVEGFKSLTYTFTPNNSQVTYTYDKDTVQAFSLTELTLATSDYKESAPTSPKSINLSKATVTGIANKTYNGKAQIQTPTVKLDGKTLKSGTDYALSYKNNKNAGTATVTITGKGNYTGSISKTFKINPASIAKATVTGISNKAYTGKAISQSPTIKLNGATLKANTDYVLSYKNNIKPGTATVTITGKGNYSASISKTFKITKAAPSPATGKTGWNQNDCGRWYKRSNGTYPKNAWEKIGGKWYHFNNLGYLETNWITVSGAKYWLGSDGAMRTGWQKLGNNWYFFSGSGAMQTGWVKSGGWYYMDKSTGIMCANEWREGYWINASGTWTYKHKGTWRKSSGKWWFGDSSGWYAKNGTQKIDGKVYRFDRAGWCLNP